MQLFEDPTFKRTVKKLKPNQKQALYEVLREIIADPGVGIKKKGDLRQLQVHKFHMTNQQMLLAYVYDSDNNTLNLLSLGSHENFYRDLKKD